MRLSPRGLIVFALSLVSIFAALPASPASAENLLPELEFVEDSTICGADAVLVIPAETSVSFVVKKGVYEGEVFDLGEGSTIVINCPERFAKSSPEELIPLRVEKVGSINNLRGYVTAGELDEVKALNYVELFRDNEHDGLDQPWRWRRW